jgi:hypothetical protein
MRSMGNYFERDRNNMQHFLLIDRFTLGHQGRREHSRWNNIFSVLSVCSVAKI